MNRARWLAWILGLAVAVAAAPDVAHANKHLKKAHKAYAKLKYELVIKHLKRAIKIAKTEPEQIEIYEFLGRMYVMYGKDDLARASFVEVLKRDPSFAFPDTESPKILATLEEARAESGAVVGGVVVSTEDPPDEAGDGTTATDDPLPTDDSVTEEIVAAPTDDTENGATQPPDPMLTTVESSSEFYETWWFWTAVGVVVVGAATGATLAITMKPGPPDGDFGAPIQMP